MLNYLVWKRLLLPLTKVTFSCISKVYNNSFLSRQKIEQCVLYFSVKSYSYYIIKYTSFFVSSVCNCLAKHTLIKYIRLNVPVYIIYAYLHSTHRGQTSFHSLRIKTRLKSTTDVLGDRNNVTQNANVQFMFHGLWE